LILREKKKSESDNCNIDDFDYYPIASVLKKIQEKQLANTT
jgi:hypothetical protein